MVIKIDDLFLRFQKGREGYYKEGSKLSPLSRYKRQYKSCLSRQLSLKAGQFIGKQRYHILAVCFDNELFWIVVERCLDMV
jgi:hypothetical protein